MDRLVSFYGRGRLDHLALGAASEEAFREILRRVVAEGAGDGAVTDMGSLLNAGFTDPDRSEHEVVWVKPGVPVEAGLRRAEWSPARLPSALGPAQTIRRTLPSS